MNNFLERYDCWCASNEQEINKRAKRDNALLKKFLERFPVDAIPGMAIDDYVIGKRESSFCWWVETNLSELGDIRGGQLSAFQRFGIYYSRDKSDYVFHNSSAKKNRFGAHKDEVFEGVIASIVQLLESLRKHDLNGIAQNRLNPLFKNKLTYLYDSEHWLPIYGDHDLSIILSVLAIPYSIDGDRVFKRQKLFDFYVSLNRPDITPLSFMMFVYNDAGLRPYLRSEESRCFANKTNAKQYELEKVTSLSEAATNGKNNERGLVSENVESLSQKKITGKKGEEITKQFLLTHKKELGIVGKIDCPCEYDDTKHYDFSYTQEDGKTIYIESKATKANRPEEIHFEMSDLEYGFMNEHMDSYFVFYINNVFEGTKIKMIPANLVSPKPSKYRFAGIVG